ncbi:MAG TPA: signal peptidase I [Thermomicrobiales bacterium]|nr:signal peptidase I [Thermomicrobiales bacterium]
MPHDTTPSRIKPALRQRLALLGEILPIVILLVIAISGIRIVFQPYQVVGASMSPALANGERLFVNRAAYSSIPIPGVGDVHPFSTPRRGDIVVLDSDKTDRHSPYIKRIVGLPGEKVSFTDGLVLIDGTPLVEDYIDGAITACTRRLYCAVTVPPGYVYVLGDNRTDSEDSRVFGPVPIDDLVGRAWFGSWPKSRFGPISRPDYGIPAINGS